MSIKPHTPYLSNQSLEEIANWLLDQYGDAIGPIVQPPVPVEEIADFLLELGLEWLPIPDSDESPILAYLHIDSRTIRLNENRLDFFEAYPGTYAFTLAHEIGHHLLHTTPASRTSVPDTDQPGEAVLHRQRLSDADIRERQAEQFASFLLMPDRLLQPAIAAGNIYRWTDLYRLRDQFNVSITALRIRLEKLGLLYVAPNKNLYPSKTQALQELRKDSQYFISRGRLYRDIGDIPQAKTAYKLALDLVREIGDKREEAYCAWALGQLYLDTDLAQAIELMSICVTYQKQMGHPEAEADAHYLERLKLIAA